MDDDPLADVPFPAMAGGAVVTIGTFDGVHRGHQDILRLLEGRARAAGLPSVLVTFSSHPLSVLNPAAAPRLLTPGVEQREIIVQCGAPDYVILLPFTRQLASYSARQFVRHLLLERYEMKELVVGYDHGLGRGREGDVMALIGFGQEFGFEVTVVEPTTLESGLAVSSSGIRRAVAYGQLPAAAEGLGRPYGFRAVVVQGSQRGREIGYPTLNLSLDVTDKLLPPEGVYAVRATSALGTFGGMLNLGGRPTFGDEILTPEVHLFEADGDWYGLSVRVDFIARLRDTVRFDGVAALVAQLDRDAAAAKALVLLDARAD